MTGFRLFEMIQLCQRDTSFIMENNWKHYRPILKRRITISTSQRPFLLAFFASQISQERTNLVVRRVSFIAIISTDKIRIRHKHFRHARKKKYVLDP